jgi:hypothetical protein
MRRHYVYYRVSEADLERVSRVVLGWQNTLRERHAGLQAELLRRPEPRGGEITLMEVCGPLDDALADAIEGEARTLLPGVQRHVEVFDPIDA